MNEVHVSINNPFGTSNKKLDHLSAATRLLSMWRPDLFFCLNGANEKSIAFDFDMPVTGPNGIHTRDGYWRVANEFQNTLWGQSLFDPLWNADKQSCWNGRVAMIDAIYY